MSAPELLQKAVEYDSNGRRHEALKLYERGIQQLLQMCKTEGNADKKHYLQAKVQEYIERAEQIQKRIQKCQTVGKVVDRISIIDGAKNFSYETIFKKYLDSKVHEIAIEEPWLQEYHQLDNLLVFFELVVKRCGNLKYIKLLTIQDMRNKSEQPRAFEKMSNDLRSQAIHLEVTYNQNLHDRQIILGNGYIIKSGRGLDYFKKGNGRFTLGYYDFDYRECKETNIDIFECAQ